VDAQGTIFVADSENSCLRQVSPGDGAVSTLAGDAVEDSGFADGQGETARFDGPLALALDTDSHLIVADFGNNCIRKVTTAEGRVTTWLGAPKQAQRLQTARLRLCASTCHQVLQWTATTTSWSPTKATTASA